MVVDDVARSAGGGHSAITVGPAFILLLILLAVAAAAVAWAGHLGEGRAVLTASARAVLQLAAVSVVIAAVLRSWWTTAAFIVLMFAVAAFTSARRVSTLRRAAGAAIPIAAGVVPVGGAILGVHPMPMTPIAVLPIAGILIGGAMTATSLAGRRALDELTARHGEYEAALALGFTDRQAALEITRQTAGRALVPALDQTRTVGLVSLPGAFVGVLLGGGSAAQAGATQLLVLIALLAVEAVAAALTVELVAAGVVRAESRSSAFPHPPRGRFPAGRLRG